MWDPSPPGTGPQGLFRPVGPPPRPSSPRHPLVPRPSIVDGQIARPWNRDRGCPAQAQVSDSSGGHPGSCTLGRRRQCSGGEVIDHHPAHTEQRRPRGPHVVGLARALGMCASPRWGPLLHSATAEYGPPSPRRRDLWSARTPSSVGPYPLRVGPYPPTEPTGERSIHSAYRRLPPLIDEVSLVATSVTLAREAAGQGRVP